MENKYETVGSMKNKIAFCFVWYENTDCEIFFFICNEKQKVVYLYIQLA